MNAINDVKNQLSRLFEAAKLHHGLILLLGAGLLGLTLHQSAVLANDDAPPAHLASPEVYKVLDENDQFRVIQATWRSGQADDFHSHPADRVSLYQTDCTLRLTNADGSSRVGKPKAGTARARSGMPVKSHKAENLGDKDCVITIVELK